MFCLHIEDSLRGLWWLLQTITSTNGPQSTLKLQPVVHFTSLQATFLVEPISCQLFKQFNHLTTTVTSYWRNGWTYRKQSFSLWNHFLNSTTQVYGPQPPTIIHWIHHLVQSNLGNSNHYSSMNNLVDRVDLFIYCILLFILPYYHMYINSLNIVIKWPSPIYEAYNSKKSSPTGIFGLNSDYLTVSLKR